MTSRGRVSMRNWHPREESGHTISCTFEIRAGDGSTLAMSGRSSSARAADHLQYVEVMHTPTSAGRYSGHEGWMGLGATIHRHAIKDDWQTAREYCLPAEWRM